MIETMLKFAVAFPIAIIIIFIVSLPFYYLLLGLDEQAHNGDYDGIIGIPLCIIIIILILCFG